MKIRKIIFGTFLSALVCFGLCQQVQSAIDTPDPGRSLPTSNTADGQGALGSLTTGLYNSAFGFLSLLSNGSANFNTGVGAGVLLVNTASNNTAVGAGDLFSNNTGNGNANGNTAVGTQALFSNGDGTLNDAVGAFALLDNTDGFGNNASGNTALFFNVIGVENTALGDVALAFNDFSGAGLGNNNTAVGGAALFNNVDGSENTAVGTGSGPNVIAGFNNTYVGDFLGMCVGIACSGPVPDESSTIRIGDLSENGFGSAACFIGGIFNNFQPVNGVNIVQVTLDLNTDQLGFDFGPSQGGAPAAPRSAPQRRSAPGAPTQRPALNNGKVGKVEKLEATVAQQQKQIETLTAQLKEQAAQIQKVSAQLEVSKPAPQVVVNKP